MITSLLLISMLQIQSSAPKSDTTYISTTGSRFYLSAEARFEDFALLTLSDTVSAVKAIQYLKSSTASGKMGYQMMLNLLLRQIAVRNYSKEQCIVLISPRTRTGMLGQPFRIGSDPTLIFTFSDEKPETDDYASVRVLVWPRENNTLSAVVRCGSRDIKPMDFIGAP